MSDTLSPHSPPSKSEAERRGFHNPRTLVPGHDAPAERGKFFAGLVHNSFGRQRYSAHALLLTVVGVVIWFGNADLARPTPVQVDLDWAAGQAAAPTPFAIRAIMPAVPGVEANADALTRLTDIHTYIPDRSRLDITNYTAQKGDTILGIAEKFGLSPETIVFGNPFLKDNPHFLEPGQTLRIAPADGIIRDVIAGDTLGGLARVYGAKPDDIINWPPNQIDPDNPQIKVGQVLFVPGGTRGLIRFSESDSAAAGSASTSSGSSNSSSSSTAAAKAPWVLNSGAGACLGGLAGGVSGSGAFIWPATHHYVSGYNFSSIHPGVDVDGETGEPAYAADSGVVVFAGWSDWGYGNTVVVDHGNRWWTLYAHLSAIFVGCGQGIYQGNQIGAIGNTGHSQGAHLHFEIYYGIYQTNPWDVLPPP